MPTQINLIRALIIIIVISCVALMTLIYTDTGRITNVLEGFKSQINQVNTRFPLKPVRICCLILTTPKNFLTFTRAVNETWAPRCDRYFFVSEYPEGNFTLEQKQFSQQIPLAPIGNVTTGRKHLTTKMTKAFLFAYEHHLNDFDWFIKADDDTYLVMGNLRRFLGKQDPTEPVTFGYSFKVIRS